MTDKIWLSFQASRETSYMLMTLANAQNMNQEQLIEKICIKYIVETINEIKEMIINNPKENEKLIEQFKAIMDVDIADILK